MVEPELVAELEHLVDLLDNLIIDAGLEVEVGVTDDERLLSFTFVGYAGGPEPTRRTIGHVPGRVVRRAWSEDRPRNHQDPMEDSHER